MAARLDVGLVALTERSPDDDDRPLTLHCCQSGILENQRCRPDCIERLKGGRSSGPKRSGLTALTELLQHRNVTDRLDGMIYSNSGECSSQVSGLQFFSTASSVTPVMACRRGLIADGNCCRGAAVVASLHRRAARAFSAWRFRAAARTRRGSLRRGHRARVRPRRCRRPHAD